MGLKFFSKPYLAELSKGKLRGVYSSIVDEILESGGPSWDQYYFAASLLDYDPHVVRDPQIFRGLLQPDLEELLRSPKRKDRVFAAIRLVAVAYCSLEPDLALDSNFRERVANIESCVFGQLATASCDRPTALCMSWALAWSGTAFPKLVEPSAERLLLLFRFWSNADTPEFARIAGWAFGAQPLLQRDLIESQLPSHAGDLWQITDNKEDERDSGKLALMWYMPSSVSEEDLAQACIESIKDSRFIDCHMSPTALRILDAQGGLGHKALRKWKNRMKEYSTGSEEVRAIFARIGSAD